jgi:hypothetical protein
MSAAYDIFADDVDDLAVDASRIKWPAPSWRGRHFELARDLLGYRSLERLQKQIIAAYYAHDRAKIAACTGQKRGKTEVEIICILVDFATEPNLNYFLFAPKIDHTNEVLWPRLAKVAVAAYYPCADCMPAHRTWCSLVEVDPLDETPRPERCANCSPLIPSDWKNPKDHSEGRVSEWLNPEKSEGGLRAPDGRIVRGYAARKLGAKGGLSGVVRIGSDESNDIDDETEDSWDGNLMGGGKRLSFGNLLNGFTRWFGKAFAANKNEYTATFRESSRLSQNCRGRIHWSDGAITEDGRWILFPGGSTKRPVGCLDNPHEPNARPIKGIADVIGIEAYLNGGKRSKNLVAARVDAEAPVIVDGQLVSLARLTEAEKRWTPAVDGEGVLQLGVDVARMRDRLAIAVRRGNTIVEIFAEALGQEDHVRGVEIVIEYGKKYRRPHERKPRLVYDVTGPEGKSFRRELQAQNAAEHFDIHSVEMGNPPKNRGEFDKCRDELAIGFAEWLRHGAIPINTRLESQLENMTAKRVEVSYGLSGAKWTVSRVPTNDEMRNLLGGESPDEFDACKLAVLDVDGSETEAPANDTAPREESQIIAAETKQVQQAPQAPANDVMGDFDDLDMSDRLDAFTRMSWGQS